MRFFKQNTTDGQGVQDRRLYLFSPVAAQVISAGRIQSNEEKVRLQPVFEFVSRSLRTPGYRDER